MELSPRNSRTPLALSPPSLPPPGLPQVALLQYPAACGLSHRASTHDYMAFGLCTGGQASLKLRQVYRLEPGDLYLIPAGEAHTMVKTERLELWGAAFSPTGLAPEEASPLLAPFERVRFGASAVTRIPASRQSHLEWLLRTMRDEGARADKPLDAWVLRHLLSLILAEVVRAEPLGTPTSTPPLVTGAMRFIAERCLEPVSLADVAMAVQRTPSHVASSVKAATGKSVQTWIIEGRMAEAQRRLMHTEESLDEIAERVGYADITHFIRLFRRTYGQTPAAWRRLHRGG